MMKKIKILFRIEQILSMIVLLTSGYLAWALSPGGMATAHTVYICAAVIFIAALGCNVCRYLPVFMKKK